MGSWEHHSKGTDDSAKVVGIAVIGVVAVLFLPMIIHAIMMILFGAGMMLAGIGVATAAKFYLNHRDNRTVTTVPSYKELLAEREANGRIPACTECGGFIYPTQRTLEGGRRTGRITRGKH